MYISSVLQHIHILPTRLSYFENWSLLGIGIGIGIQKLFSNDRQYCGFFLIQGFLSNPISRKRSWFEVHCSGLRTYMRDDGLLALQHTHTYTHLHTHTHTPTHTPTHTYTHTPTHTYTHPYTPLHTPTHTHLVDLERSTAATPTSQVGIRPLYNCFQRRTLAKLNSQYSISSQSSQPIPPIEYIIITISNISFVKQLVSIIII